MARSSFRKRFASRDWSSTCSVLVLSSYSAAASCVSTTAFSSGVSGASLLFVKGVLSFHKGPAVPASVAMNDMAPRTLRGSRVKTTARPPSLRAPRPVTQRELVQGYGFMQ
eukprot:7389149-Prymnesium_polylepis.2